MSSELFLTLAFPRMPRCEQLPRSSVSFTESWEGATDGE